MLAHCAYHVTINPPTKVKGHPSIRLLYAPRERSYLKPLGACKANEWYLECLKGLVDAVPNQPAVFEYYHDLILFRCLPMPLHKIIGDDVKVYREAGIDGIASLSFQQFDRWGYGPNTYVLGKALWRGQGDPHDMEEYCADVYGSAARPMQRYFDMLFELCATAMDTCPYDGFIDLRHLPPNQPGLKEHDSNLAPLVTTDHLDKIEQQIDEADRVAGERYRQRVDEQRMLWEFARYEVCTLYEGIRTVPVIDAARSPSSTPKQRAEAIRRLQQIVERIDEGTELLERAPIQLRGPFAEKGKHAMNDRAVGYKHFLLTGINELEARDK
jgi:hypothetical protein